MFTICSILGNNSNDNLYFEISVVRVQKCTNVLCHGVTQNKY